MSDAVLISRTGDVVTWTLNRPDTRNAISEIDMIEPSKTQSPRSTEIRVCARSF